MTQIIWKDVYREEGWEGFHYGVHFTQILDEDRNNLNQILSGQASFG